ncbi:MAG: hypothetical protein R3E50_02025 [Halioglobus sp.]
MHGHRPGGRGGEFCEEGRTGLVQGPAFRPRRGGAGIGLVLGEPAVGHQPLEVDEVGVACVYRHALVGAAVRVRRAQRQHLPDLQARVVQQVDKTAGGGAQVAAEAPVGQAAGVQQDARPAALHQQGCHAWPSLSL